MPKDKVVYVSASAHRRLNCAKASDLPLRCDPGSVT